VAHEHARKDETNTDKPPSTGATCLADERGRRAAGEKEGRMFRDGSRVTLPRERDGGGKGGMGKVPPNVLEVSQKENSDVGWDPGSKCIT